MKQSIFSLTAIVAGILAAFYLAWPPLVWLLVTIAIVWIAAMLAFYHRPGLGWMVVAILFSITAFYGTMVRESYCRQLQWNKQFHRKEVIVQGIVIKRLERIENGTCRMTVKLASSGEKYPVGVVSVFFKGFIPETVYGRRLAIHGWFKAVELPTVGAPAYLENHRITGSISVVEQPAVVNGKGIAACFIWAEALRRRMLRFGRDALEPSDAQVLHGMVFGEKLPESPVGIRLKQGFQRTGTVHLLTVSGLHVGFIVAMLSFILGRLGVPKRWRILPLTAGVGFYIMMTGMETPVFRAGLMLMIYLVAQLLGTKDDALNRLCLAASILLLLNPYTLFEISFQLSFAATLGVVWLFPILRDFFPVKHYLMKLVWNGLLLSIGAQLIFIPLAVYYFQQISWGSPLVNLVILVPAQIVVVFGLVGEWLGLFLPCLGKLVLTFVSWNIWVIRGVVDLCTGFPWIGSWSPVWPWPWMIGYYLGLLIWIDWRTPNLLTGEHPKLRRSTIVLMVLVLINTVVWGRLVFKWQRDYLEIAMIDVGQGDAIYLRSPKGNCVLVDAGDDGRGQGRVLPFLRRQGVTGLDLVFGTHGHRDHLGGLTEVLSEVPAKAVYLPESVDPEGFEIKKLSVQLQEMDIPLHRVANRVRFRLDQRIDCEIMFASEAFLENDRSLLLWIGYGKNKLLLTGDLGVKGEEMIIKQSGALSRISGLKVGHHGSNQASGLSFLSQLQPDFAVISAGRDNRYGHPGQMTLNRIRSLGIKVFRTDTHGTVRLKMYPDKTVVVTER